MAEQMEPLAPATYAPTYLFSSDGDMECVETPEAYEALWKAGWRDTPAAFGMETHPTRKVETVRETVMPKNDPQEVVHQTLERQFLELQHFVLGLHAKHEQQAQQMEAHAKQLQQLGEQHAGLTSMVQEHNEAQAALAQRLQQVETARQGHQGQAHEPRERKN